MNPSTRRVALLAAGLMVVPLGACHAKKAEQPSASTESVAPSTEWVRENPTEPAVPVDLPGTAITNAPASGAVH